ncbi:MAG: glycerol-3-phosphate dehydrogenase [Candidatus Puniceispirillaceae bacterium]
MSKSQATKTTKTDYDIFIIGGGINGCGIARELAARGYHIGLADMRDLSSGTSSWSTKLIHGGLRYLEYYEFGLVRKALQEREVLMKMAPHLIHPLRFVLPHAKGMRPKWLLRAGLFLYDYLGPRKILPPSRSLNLTTDKAGEILKSDFKSGFEYSDCMVDDNRLTILNARAAASFGATIMPRNKVESLHFKKGVWQITTQSGTLTASVIINAGGPWADIVRQSLDVKSAGQDHNRQMVRLVRGSHILTRKLYDHDKAYIFQNSDGRILFTIPYLDDFTLIGTTDIDHDTSPDNPQISEAEIAYICREVSAYLSTDISPKDVLHHYSGVRPLFDDGAEDAKSATRDYVLDFEEGTDNRFLNVFGGKLTTYRQLALQVAEKIAPVMPAPSDKRAGTIPLPGGDIKNGDFAAFMRLLADQFPALEHTYLRRLACAYGTEIYHILGTPEAPRDQGIDFGLGLRQAEVDFLIHHEWAQTADDILMRRSKLGYHADEAMIKQLSDYLASCG